MVLEVVWGNEGGLGVMLGGRLVFRYFWMIRIFFFFYFEDIGIVELRCMKLNIIFFIVVFFGFGFMFFVLVLELKFENRGVIVKNEIDI